LNGGELEKFVRGRPSFAAFDLPGWIARADAVGLSLYTNSGFPDFGHRSVKAIINLAALARMFHTERGFAGDRRGRSGAVSP
jgi:hypothetical protein